MNYTKCWTILFYIFGWKRYPFHGLVRIKLFQWETFRFFFSLGKTRCTLQFVMGRYPPISWPILGISHALGHTSNRIWPTSFSKVNCSKMTEAVNVTLLILWGHWFCQVAPTLATRLWLLYNTLSHAWLQVVFIFSKKLQMAFFCFFQAEAHQQDYYIRNQKAPKGDHDAHKLLFGAIFWLLVPVLSQTVNPWH